MLQCPMYIVFLSLEIDFVLTNSTDPDEMPYYGTFHLGLLYFQSTSSGVPSIQRVTYLNTVSIVK